MKNNSLKNLLKIAGVSAAALCLAACGGSTAPSTTAAAGTGAAAATTAASGEVKLAENQVLNLTYTDLSLLDVNDVRNANEFQVLTEVQEGLFRTFVVDGTEIVENAGCTSYEVSEDDLTYTFHLRDNAVWSDGVKVTAQNYVDSWLRLLNPEEGFSYAFLGTGIEGAEEYYNGEGPVENVKIAVVDDLTFTCTLKAPDPAFVKKVAMVCFYPIRKDLIDAAAANGGNWTNDYTLHVYNGPFVIADRVLENSMTLKKNESYWDAENVTLTQVNLRVVAESSTQAQMMESQQLDILTLSDLEYVSMWENRVKEGTFNYKASNTPSVTYLVVDQHAAGNGGTSGLMLNEKCRLAMSLAIDREEYNEMFQEGLATPAYSIIPYGITVGDYDFRDAYEEPLAQYADKTNDAAYLKNLFEEGLKELGHSGNAADETLTVFTYNPTSQTTNILEWYKQQFESKLGCKVNVETYPDVSTWKQARDSYQYDFYTMGWNGDYNDPMTFLELWVTGNGYAKFMGGYSNEEYDALIKAAGESQDDKERLELFGKAEKLLMETAGVIPLYFNTEHTYTQSYVSNLSMPMFGAQYEFSRVQILAH